MMMNGKQEKGDQSEMVYLKVIPVSLKSKDFALSGSQIKVTSK